MSRLGLAIDEVERGVEELVVDRLHALPGQRAGVLDSACRRPNADLGHVRVVARMEHAARAELLAELGVLGIVGILRLLLGVEVVEVAEELVEAVHRRQELVAVAEMVLAELAGGVAQRLEQLGDGRVLRSAGRRSAPGRPTLVRPVRIGDWPVMKAARPAVQLCWP